MMDGKGSATSSFGDSSQDSGERGADMQENGAEEEAFQRLDIHGWMGISTAAIQLFHGCPQSETVHPEVRSIVPIESNAPSSI